jgi:glucose-6-phosphate isomerase
VPEGAGPCLDSTRNRITVERIQSLLALADECGLHHNIAVIFRGDTINVSDND